MRYFINGRCMDYSEAVVYLVNLAADRLTVALDVLTNAIRDFLFSVKPGTEKIFQCARISCAR